MRELSLFNRPSKFPSVDLRSEFDKAIESFYSLFDRSRAPVTEGFEQLTLFPSVNIVEDATHYKVEVEMPGMSEEDVKVSIENNCLLIKGEKTVSKNDKDRDYLRREINYGCYERCIALPEHLKTDEAKASFKKGMLWVEFPKKTEFVKQRRELTIEKIT